MWFWPDTWVLHALHTASAPSAISAPNHLLISSVVQCSVRLTLALQPQVTLQAHTHRWPRGQRWVCAAIHAARTVVHSTCAVASTAAPGAAGPSSGVYAEGWSAPAQCNLRPYIR